MSIDGFAMDQEAFIEGQVREVLWIYYIYIVNSTGTTGAINIVHYTSLLIVYQAGTIGTINVDIHTYSYRKRQNRKYCRRYLSTSLLSMDTAVSTVEMNSVPHY